tara:strand:- start:76 stop:834 length:759 start_codon:yes stop_codon:yes gene_type:complete
MKKLLIVSGDSFTDKAFQTMIHPEIDCSWPKWPELLAKKLDMEYVNVAKSGAGNDYIYDSLVDVLQKTNKDRIGLVIAAWSQSQRRSWQESKSLIWKNSRVDSRGDIFYWVKRTIRYWYSFQVLCERYNLPYKQFQMISLFQDWLNDLPQNDNEIYANLQNPDPFFVERHIYPGKKKEDNITLSNMIIDYEKNINTKNFIGWPVIPELTGYHIEEKTFGPNGIVNGMTISKHDKHPTKLGQEEIAEFLYGQL